MSTDNFEWLTLSWQFLLSLSFNPYLFPFSTWIFYNFFTSHFSTWLYLTITQHVTVSVESLPLPLYFSKRGFTLQTNLFYFHFATKLQNFYVCRVNIVTFSCSFALGRITYTLFVAEKKSRTRGKKFIRYRSSRFFFEANKKKQHLSPFLPIITFIHTLFIHVMCSQCAP